MPCTFNVRRRVDHSEFKASLVCQGYVRRPFWGGVFNLKTMRGKLEHPPFLSYVHSENVTDCITLSMFWNELKYSWKWEEIKCTAWVWMQLAPPMFHALVEKIYKIKTKVYWQVLRQAVVLPRRESRCSTLVWVCTAGNRHKSEPDPQASPSFPMWFEMLALPPAHIPVIWHGTLTKAATVSFDF